MFPTKWPTQFYSIFCASKLFKQERCQINNLMQRIAAKRTVSKMQFRCGLASAVQVDTHHFHGIQKHKDPFLRTVSCRHLQISVPVDKDYLNINELVSILRENSCEDLCVIKVDVNRLKFHYVDYFVIVSGRSVRHLKAMAFALCAKFKERVREDKGTSTAVVEGENSNNWMVVDVGNIVVHFMMPDAREIYELEKLWTLGTCFDDQLVQMEKKYGKNEEDIALPFKSKFGSRKKLLKEIHSDLLDS